MFIVRVSFKTLKTFLGEDLKISQGINPKCWVSNLYEGYNLDYLSHWSQQTHLDNKFQILKDGFSIVNSWTKFERIKVQIN